MVLVSESSLVEGGVLGVKGWLVGSGSTSSLVETYKKQSKVYTQLIVYT